VDEFIKRYQPVAAQQQLDPLGFYLPPYAYAMMQVLGEAVQRVGKLDQEKIADDIHSHEFRTVVGNVKFAKNGEWAEGRALYVQYRGIKGNGLDEWKQPGHAVVLYPAQWKSGDLLYPYDQSRK